MSTHLVIPDPHATPDAPNDRFDYLGQLIMDLRPDKVVCLGDFADMPALSSYDKGLKSFEGRRLKLDYEATIDAQQRMFAPINEYNEVRRRNKEKQYRPDFYMLGGNHDEGRIGKVINANPEYESLVDLSALQYKEFGWQYVPFKEVLDLDGISYVHYMPSGVMGKPIGGVNLGRSLLTKCFKSVTVGHSHVWSEASDVTAGGRRIWGLSAGCFVDFEPAYAKGTTKFWWSGVAIKRDVHDGDYDLTRISLEKLRSIYGGR